MFYLFMFSKLNLDNNFICFIQRDFSIAVPHFQKIASQNGSWAVGCTKIPKSFQNLMVSWYILYQHGYRPFLQKKWFFLHFPSLAAILKKMARAQGKVFFPFDRARWDTLSNLETVILLNIYLSQRTRSKGTMRKLDFREPQTLNLWFSLKYSPVVTTNYSPMFPCYSPLAMVIPL